MTLPAPTNPASPEELTEAQGASSLTGDEHLKWASQEEALAGTETAKMISPATLAYTLENTPAVSGPEIDDASDSPIKVWSASKLTESVGDTAEMLDGILGDGDELAALKGDVGAIGPTFSIDVNHFFADATERDAYFVSNPSELVAGVVISVTAGSTGYQQYSGSAWIDKEFAVSGGGGSDLTGKFIVEFSETEVGPYGIASSRSSNSTYSTQQTNVFFPAPFKATEIWWDVNVGTFDLTVDGVNLGSQTSSSTASTLVWKCDLIFHGHHEFKVARSTGSTNLRDNNVTQTLARNNAEGVFVAPSYEIVDGGYSSGYWAPLRVKGYKSTVEAAPTS